MSLKYKISLSVIAIISFIIAAALFFLQDDFEKRVTAKINERFDRSASVFKSYFQKNNEIFSLASSIATYGATFESNFLLINRIDRNNEKDFTEYQETLLQAIKDAHFGVGEVFDMAIILDQNFEALAYFNAVDSTKKGIVGQNFENHPALLSLFDESASLDQLYTLKANNQIYNVVTDVIGNEIGYIILGQRIDNFLADDLQNSLKSSFTFMNGKKVLGTSLQRQVRLALENYLQNVQNVNEMVFKQDSTSSALEANLNGERFLLSMIPIDENNSAYSIITESLDKELQTFKDAQVIVLIIGAGAIIFGILFSIFFGNTITRPVGRLVDAVTEIEKENYNVQVDVSSKDEIGTLAQNFNKMAHGLGERFELLKFVSKNTAQMIQEKGVGNLELGGERKHLTMFFSDIRGFTAFSEKRQPEEVIEMLNLYLRKQAEIVQKHLGDIDKYVGDELMAIFDGDDGEKRAVECARDIQKTMAEINEKNGGEIAIGIGINSGEVVSGNMGSENRIDHTVLGNHVNLAARLCSKAGRHQILITDSIYKKMDDKSIFNALEPIEVKGISEPVQIYDVNY